MYLRKMGSVSLLTREGEVEIAKRIEQGELRVIDIVLHSPVAVPFMLDLYDKVKHVLPTTLIGLTPIKANHCLRFYKYEEGDFFRPHQVYAIYLQKIDPAFDENNQSYLSLI